jgi:hypothetical protein
VAEAPTSGAGDVQSFADSLKSLSGVTAVTTSEPVAVFRIQRSSRPILRSKPWWSAVDSNHLPPRKDAITGVVPIAPNAAGFIDEAQS